MDSLEEMKIPEDSSQQTEPMKKTLTNCLMVQQTLQNFDNTRMSEEEGDEGDSDHGNAVGSDDLAQVSDEQNDDSDDDSQFEDDDNEDDDDMAANQHQISHQEAALLRQLHRRAVEDGELPDTVSVLRGAGGEVLYLVGTAHFSRESCDDVEKVITMLQPDAVVVELCSSRTQVLTLDENYIQEMNEGGALDRFKKCVKQKGLVSGLVLYMMLQMSSHITKQLGMAPGGEFRAAFNQAKKVPGCHLYLGDRPVEITLQRMMAALSLWQKLRFGFMLLQDFKPISAEEVEKMKEKGIFEQMIAEIVEEFPHIAHALVTERDIFLTGFLQKVLKQAVLLPDNSIKPPVVVGVVGIGHTTGIRQRFDTEITSEQMDEIQTLPQPSRTRKMVKHAVRGAVLALAVCSVYQLAVWTGLKDKLLSLLPSSSSSLSFSRLCWD